MSLRKPTSMFRGKSLRPCPAIRVCCLLILLQLFTCGNRVILGRHVDRRFFRGDSLGSYYTSNRVPVFIDTNELSGGNGDENSKRLTFNANYDPRRYPLLQGPRQAQPEDFVFAPDVFLEKIHEEPGHSRDQDAEEIYVYVGDEGKAKSTDPVVINRNIITAPFKTCGKGERQDSKGKCKLVIMK